MAVIDGTEASNILRGTEGDDTINGGAGNDTILGLAGYDFLDGGTGNDRILGSAGHDTLIGGEGNDTLIGGIETDSLVGGAGNDTYSIVDSNDIIVEAFNEGIDTVRSTVSSSLSSNIENLILRGTTNIDAIGNALNNTLTGNNGNNVLDGGGGVNTLIGRAGNDTYIVNNADDVITELADQGIDTVISDLSFTLEPNVENLALIGTSNINGTGNAVRNIITGNSGRNTLNGGSGSDILAGAEGVDTLIGGAGNDTFIFGQGDGDDTVIDTSGVNRIRFGPGIGIADINVSTPNDNSLVLGLRGTSDSLTINDFFTGDNARNFRIILDDSTTFTANSFRNMFVGDGASNTTDDPLLTAAFSGNNMIVGNNGNDTLNGWAGNDVINGGAGSDLIMGGSGRDTIMGGTGTDSLTGGTGIDTYVYHAGDGSDTIADSSSRSIIEFGSETSLEDLTFVDSGSNINVGLRDSASDLLTLADLATGSRLVFADGTSVTITNFGRIIGLDNNLDNSIVTSRLNTLVSTTTGNDSIKGFTGNDLLNAGGGNDTIRGGSGNDTLIGFTGNDFLDGGLGNDIYLFQNGDGFDTITDAGGTDRIGFNTDVLKDNVALFRDGTDLIVDYGTRTGQDQILITNQSNKSNAIERIQLGDGEFLTAANINRIIADITNFATVNGITLNNISDVKSNDALMALIANAWHA